MAFTNIGSTEGQFAGVTQTTDTVAAAVPDLAANSLGVVLVLAQVMTNTIVGVTWDGAAMTLVPAGIAVNGIRHAAVFYKVNPSDNATVNIVVTYSLNDIATRHVTVMWADAGAAVSVDDSDVVTGTTQNPAITSTQAGANELVVSGSATAANDIAATPVTGCTQLQSYDSGANCSQSAYSIEAASGAATHTHNYSQSEVYAMASASFKEEAGGAALLKNLAELAEISEAAARKISMSRAIAETAQVLEAIGRRMSMARQAAETLSIYEAITSAKGFARSVAESLQVLEATLRKSALSRALAEAIDIGEAIGRSVALKRAIAETLSIGEVAHKAGTWLRNIAESIQISEAVNRRGSLTRTLAETVQLLEAVGSSISALITKNVSELMQLTEAAIRTSALSRAIAETEQLLEAAGRNLALRRFAAETVQLIEAIGKAGTWLRLVAESVAISETIHRPMTMARSVAETLSIDEAIGSITTAAGALIKNIVESLQLLEARLPAKWPFGVLSVEISRGYLRLSILGRGYAAALLGRVYRVAHDK